MTDYQQSYQPSYQQPSTQQPTTQQPTTTDSDPSLKDKASEAVDQGRQAAGQVAQSATEHVQDVTHEAVRQARDLVGEAREQVTRQAGDQHQNVVNGLRSLSTELGSMVERSENSGTATELVAQARDRVDGVANWLDGRQPGELVDELRTFARRRPGTFLLGALAAGVVVGRLTRGAVAAHTEDDGGSASVPSGDTTAPTSAAVSETFAPESGFAHATTAGGYEQPGESAPGYAMGGSYSSPDEPGRAGPEQGYGSTATYGDAGTQPYPAGGFPNGGQR